MALTPEGPPATDDGDRPTLVVAVCGASGSIYAVRLVEHLVRRPVSLHLVISRAGRAVMAHETDFPGKDFRAFLRDRGVAFHPEAELTEHGPDDLFAPPASGSFPHNGMAVVPCSMKTLGTVASGIADDLIGRAADVCLKEKRPLILAVRETPLSLVHIENMRRAALAGAIILPACPGFYAGPSTVEELVDTVVGRVLDHLGIDHQVTRRWGIDT